MDGVIDHEISSSMSQNDSGRREDEKQLWISLFATFLIYYRMTSSSRMPVVVSNAIAHLSGRFNMPLASTLFDSFAIICGEDIQYHFHSRESYLKQLNPNSLQFETVKSQLPRGCRIVRMHLKDADERVDEGCEVDRYNEFDDNDDDDDDDDDEIDEDTKEHVDTGMYDDAGSNSENNVNDRGKKLYRNAIKKKKKRKKKGNTSRKNRSKKQSGFDMGVFIKLFQQCIDKFAENGNSFPKMCSEGLKAGNSTLHSSPLKSPLTPTKSALSPTGDANSNKRTNPDNFIQCFVNECPEARDCVVCTQDIPARTASLTEFSDFHFHRSICKYLKSKGINQLFSHQSSGILALIKDRKNIMLTTSTSSGKSLVYTLPILQSCLDSSDSTAMMVFPTKALAQDQLKNLQDMLMSIFSGDNSCRKPVSIGTYDGDTDFKDRENVRKENRVILTNPDMLHCSILPSHWQWAKFLTNLKYIVIDEAHYYKAAFGIHSCFIFRRLRRLLFHYGSNAKFILCSATVQNPLEMTTNLTGLSPDTIEIISQDGSPSIAKKITLFNPLMLGPLIQSPISPPPAPVTGRNGGVSIVPCKSSAFSSDCPYKACVLILKRLLYDNIRTVAFVKSRQTGESLFEQLLETVPSAKHGRIACYRAGYSPSERRDIEKKIKSGELIITISTNALELGVDIGLLECTVHLGFPGSMSSIYQQIGRAGRLSIGKCESNGKALSIFIALDTPLEQHFMNNPQQFFERHHEAVHLNPENEEIMARHIVLALKEEPFEFRHDDCEFLCKYMSESSMINDINIKSSIVRCPQVWFGLKSRFVIDSLIANLEIFVIKHPTHSSFSIPLLGSPPPTSLSQNNEVVNIRAADNRRVSVVDITTMETIETLELSSALIELYEGSVYLHRAKSYICLEFDPSKLVRYVKSKEKLSYFTTHRGHLAVRIDGLLSLRTIHYGNGCQYEDGDKIDAEQDKRSMGRGSELRVGKVTISKTIYGYEIRSKKNAMVLDRKEVHQEPYTFETKAIWSEIPSSVQEEYYLAKSGSAEKFGLGVSLRKGKTGKRGVELYAGEYDRGALHSIEHVLCSLAPLVITCDPRDLGCQCTRREGDVNRYYLLLFETSRGGLGIVDKLADRWMHLLKAAFEIISKCKCTDGCLSCIHCPSCGEYNHGLDKAGAILILSKLLGL